MSTQLLRIPAVAERLAVSRRHVLNAIKSGHLAAVDVGTGTTLPAYRVPEDALEDYLAERAVKP